MKQYNSQFADAFYQLVEAVEVVVALGGERETFRIEAIEGPAGTFTTRAYVLRDLLISSTQTGESAKAWTLADLPQTHRQSADDAIDQALSFLNERARSDQDE